MRLVILSLLAASMSLIQATWFIVKSKGDSYLVQTEGDEKVGTDKVKSGTDYRLSSAQSKPHPNRILPKKPIKRAGKSPPRKRSKELAERTSQRPPGKSPPRKRSKELAERTSQRPQQGGADYRLPFAPNKFSKQAWADYGFTPEDKPSTKKSTLGSVNAYSSMHARAPDLPADGNITKILDMLRDAIAVGQKNLLYNSTGHRGILNNPDSDQKVGPHSPTSVPSLRDKDLTAGLASGSKWPANRENMVGDSPTSELDRPADGQHRLPDSMTSGTNMLANGLPNGTPNGKIMPGSKGDNKPSNNLASGPENLISLPSVLPSGPARTQTAVALGSPTVAPQQQQQQPATVANNNSKYSLGYATPAPRLGMNPKVAPLATGVTSTSNGTSNNSSNSYLIEGRNNANTGEDRSYVGPAVVTTAVVTKEVTSYELVPDVTESNVISSLVSNSSTTAAPAAFGISMKSTDRSATAEERSSTSEDRSSTSVDRSSTSVDRSSTSVDRSYSTSDSSATAAGAKKQDAANSTQKSSAPKKDCPVGMTACGTSCVNLAWAWTKTRFHMCGDTCLDMEEPCSGGLNATCQAGLTQCEGKCVNVTQMATQWQLCDAKCQPATQLCKGMCPAGMVACEGGCKIAQFYQACNNTCKSIGEACNGVCPNGTTSCGARCLLPAVSSSYRICGNECLAAAVPCNGTCPPETVKCGADRCLTEKGGEKAAFYECHGACVKALTACDGKCPEKTKNCGAGCCSDEISQILYKLEHPTQGR